ncbi:hypothetical protein B7H23_15675 [Notoacmeibacter marinus]|uniref:DUF2007 domain-containing protein n=1 Tax=Notoacmeibacter marinus TaxID=1876515 RepID=A0A231UUG0_9HYPH|nr:DUF2007 domain-containing protein [Notoacmeibacter marinus]OXS99568.1 hypothetical protein B7H23_15675 [Notoacmeibacter marinus]
MDILYRSNNAVELSFVEALLRDAGIRYMVADQNMSIMEGSLGILPRRVLVDPQDLDRAARLLADADIERGVHDD